MTASSDPGQDERIARYLGAVHKDKKRQLQATRTPQRIVVGLWLGALVGLSYGIVSQGVNSWMLPGVPLAHAPLSLPGNILLYALAGAVVGIAAGLPSGALTGVSAAAIVGTILLQALAWYNEVTSSVFDLFGSAGVPIAIFGVFVSFVVMLLVGLLIRWAIDVLGDEKDLGMRSWPRIRAILLPLLLAAGAGFLVQYDEPDRLALQRMHALIQQNLAASIAADLSPELQADRVTAFLLRPGDRYTLEPDQRLIYAIPDIDPIHLDTAVIARFDHSYVLVCGWANSGAAFCVDYLAQSDGGVALGEEQPNGLSG